MSEYFDGNEQVWWSKKYSPLLNTITNQQNMDPVEPGFKNFYSTNAHILIMAAALGLAKGLKGKVDSNSRNGIPINVFQTNDFGSQKLCYYMALIVFLDSKDEKANIIRKENTNDQDLINKFQELAEGGLSYLNNEQYNPANTDVSAEKVLKIILVDYIKRGGL